MGWLGYVTGVIILGWLLVLLANFLNDYVEWHGGRK